jgi:hypothetical protein
MPAHVHRTCKQRACMGAHAHAVAAAPAIAVIACFSISRWLQSFPTHRGWLQDGWLCGAPATDPDLWERDFIVCSARRAFGPLAAADGAPESREAPLGSKGRCAHAQCWLGWPPAQRQRSPVRRDTRVRRGQDAPGGRSRRQQHAEHPGGRPAGRPEARFTVRGGLRGRGERWGGRGRGAGAPERPQGERAGARQGPLVLVGDPTSTSAI